MNKQIDPAVQERIRALCKQVTVAYDVDAELQEELYGHMEDKLLAYMAGEEKLSEEDAFILVREHFGKAEALQELLQAVHEPGEEEEPGLHVSLPRRLTAVLALTVATVLAGNGIVRWEGVFAFAPNSILFLIALAVYAAGACVVWMVLLWWQRQLNRGEQPWFARWRAFWMWVVAAGAFAAPLCIPNVRIFAEQVFYPGRAGTVAVLMLVLGTQILQHCAWFWWTDRPPRTGRGLQWTFLCLVGFNVYTTVLTQWEQVLRIRERLSLETREAFPAQLLNAIAFQFAFIVFMTLLAYGVYRLARYVRRQTARRRTHGEVVA